MLADVNVGMAYLAGMAGFLAPCTLAIVPLFLIYMTGTGLLWGRSVPQEPSGLLLLSAVIFALGFGIAFIASWSFPDTFLGRGPATPVINRVSGSLMILMGLLATGLLGLGLVRWLGAGGRVRAVAYGLSFVVGIAFAVGWTPCVGTTLGQILSLTAGPQGSAAAVLLAVYTAGLMLPFLALGWGIGWVVRGLVGKESLSRWATPIVGVLLVIIGVTVFTENLRDLTGYFFALNPGLLLL